MGLGKGSGRITARLSDSGVGRPRASEGKLGPPLARRRAPRPSPVTRAAGFAGCRRDPQPPAPLGAALAGAEEAAVEVAELERGAPRAPRSDARGVIARVSGSGHRDLSRAGTSGARLARACGRRRPRARVCQGARRREEGALAVKVEGGDGECGGCRKVTARVAVSESSSVWKNIRTAFGGRRVLSGCSGRSRTRRSRDAAGSASLRWSRSVVDVVLRLSGRDASPSNGRLA